MFVITADKKSLLSHIGLVIWMIGYSGSGKATLVYGAEKKRPCIGAYELSSKESIVVLYNKMVPLILV